MFDLKSASFAAGQNQLLAPIDITFDQGCVHGLIGHNGSGKSTLLKLLARQHPASSGKVQFDGRSLADWGDREFARQVAYLPQQLPPAESVTTRELITFGRYPWHGLLRRLNQRDHQQIDRAIALTQTDALTDRLVDTLSGGERQRVWLAMLLAQGSRFLLLDEPLAALDISHQVDVLNLIRRLSEELGLGVIIVLHDINMAARYCDYLVALHGGQLLAQGRPNEMMTTATLAAIYGIPMQVIQSPDRQHKIAVLE